MCPSMYPSTGWIVLGQREGEGSERGRRRRVVIVTRLTVWGIVVSLHRDGLCLNHVFHSELSLDWLPFFV